MIAKNKKKSVLTIALISVAIIFANSLLVNIFLFVPLEEKDLSSDNLDQSDIEKLPTNIDDIEERSFIHTINGKKYLAEYVTQDDVEEMKKKCDLRDFSKDYNQIIDGYGTGLAPPTEESYDNLVGKISIKEVISESVKSSAITSSVDLSTEIYFPAVGNQGQQGSCSSWANVYYAYGYMEAKDNGWDAKSGNYPEYLLSPAWAYNKLAIRRLHGSWPSDNAQLMTEWGVATLNTMPYDQWHVVSWGDEPAWREAPYHRPLDYSLITYEGEPTIDTIKSLLASEIPVTFIIDSRQYYFGLNDTTGDYILSSGEYTSKQYNHAQCIVGYDDLITEGNDVGAFRVVNSWGDNWMDDGFYWLTYEAFKEFGGLNWQELIFFKDRIDYEPSLIATWEFSCSPTRMDDIITLGVGLHYAPLNSITPHYQNDENRLFPTFMALDISDFQFHYDSDDSVNFYLEIGSSNTPGIISSFLVERYVSGELEEITPQPLDVPKTTPGYVTTLFSHNIENPIHIDGFAMNNWQWAKNQELCSGSGTEIDPYVIKDLIIDGGGSATGSCITIKNSNAYFRIKNCKLYKSGFGGKDAGIRLIRTNNGEIINNDISQNLYGIWLKNSNENNLTNNILSENFVSITLSNSNENIVSENTFSDNHIGISIMGKSSDNTIYSNFFYKSSFSHAYYGIYSGSGNLWDNGVFGNYWDDYIGRDNNGDSIGDTPYVIDIDNIDNYPLWEDGPIYIDEFGGGDYTWEEASARYWCSGSGTEENPYVIKDLIIDGGGSGTGIVICYSNVYFRIENCKVHHSETGIELFNTINGQIINNDCSNNNNYGIFLGGSCYDNIISRNTCNDNGYGIALGSSANNTIAGNSCNDNSFGISLYASWYNFIAGNTANNNNEYGIYLGYQSKFNNISGNTADNNGNGYYGYGIYLDGYDGPAGYDPVGNTISGNTANNNNEDGICLAWLRVDYDYDYQNMLLGNDASYNGNNGIFFYNSHSQEVSYNTASYNGYYGIELESSWYNFGWGNYLPNNGYGPIYLDDYSGNNNIEYTE